MTLRAPLPRFLFFYGTLAPGHGNPAARLARRVLDTVGPGWTAGTLLAVPDPQGWFPALVEGRGRVRGVLCRAGPRFDRRALAALDRWEACDPRRPARSDYRRVTVRVAVGPRRVPAQAYCWARPCHPGLRVLAGGDFAGFVGAAAGRRVFGSMQRGSCPKRYPVQPFASPCGGTPCDT